MIWQKIAGLGSVAVEIAAEAEKRKDAIETDQQNIGSDIDGDSADVQNSPTLNLTA